MELLEEVFTIDHGLTMVGGESVISSSFRFMICIMYYNLFDKNNHTAQLIIYLQIKVQNGQIQRLYYQHSTII